MLDDERRSPQVRGLPELARLSDAEHYARWEAAFKRRLPARWQSRSATVGVAALWFVPMVLSLWGSAQIATWFAMPESLRVALVFATFVVAAVLTVKGLDYFMRRKLGRVVRRAMRDVGVPICVGCGYDLRASPGPRCPECGYPFNPAETPDTISPRSGSTAPADRGPGEDASFQ